MSKDDGNSLPERLLERLTKLEEEIERRENELDLLRDRLKRLQDARNVILHELAGPAVEEPEQLLMPLSVEQSNESATSLRDAVAQFVKRKPVIGGWSAAELASVLRGLGRGQNVHPRVFYSMVYTALMRAVRAGELREIQTGTGRRFTTA